MYVAASTPQFAQVKNIIITIRLEDRWSRKKEIRHPYTHPEELVGFMATISALIDELLQNCFDVSAINTSRQWEPAEIACLQLGRGADRLLRKHWAEWAEA